MTNFALIGAGGYIAPRHIQAIKDTGNNLVAAMDPNDSVGILDRYYPEVSFFTEFERFDSHLETLRRGNDKQRVEYVSICSPNYLHDSHIRLALRVGAHAICEKPLVVHPWNIDALQELEAESDRRVFTVLQLRLLPALVEMKKKFESEANRKRVDIDLSYITRRGPWYHQSWKGDHSKSGGVALNIGIHFFDFLSWMFGKAHETEVHLSEASRMAGIIELEWARVRWFLSVAKEDLPAGYMEAGKPAHRSITIDGKEMEFSDGFTDLHTRVYKDILNGGGYGLGEAKPAIELVHKIRNCEVVSPAQGRGHPILKGR